MSRRKQDNLAEAVEITTFKLRAGLDADGFVALNAGIDEWLRRQPGFQSRRIGALEDGSIVDVLVWDSAAQGRDAAARIVAETADSPVHAAIDQRTVVWQIAEVQQLTTAIKRRSR
jgi:hypothetical protein